MAEDDNLDRGLVTDAFQKFQRNEGVTSLFNKVQGAVHDIRSEFDHIAGRATGVAAGQHEQHRFDSFAKPRDGNVKWFVDGCGYFWAVSVALQEARESIWILDWWLSPELYLRRPPAKNEQYRLDRMLQAAAERGVKINVIVYKEVPQALSLDSEYTKHYLEKLHPNIAVFRHPDHLPDAQTFHSSLVSSLQGLSLNAATASKLSNDAFKSLYGMKDDIVLYWAHHEKLCIVDATLVFMGGLDLCYGRWDTNQHSIADAHPGDLNAIVFPGQDFNNARIMDFEDVSRWENNKLDRKYSSRMGWSDVSISVRGPVVEDLRRHFVSRWNFIYNEKYNVRKDSRYYRLDPDGNLGQGPAPPPQQYYAQQSQYSHQDEDASTWSRPEKTGNTEYPRTYDGSGRTQESIGHHRGREPGSSSYMHRLEQEVFQEGEELRERFEKRAHHMQERITGSRLPNYHQSGPMSCQLVRSASKWSNGTETEHSIANAYATLIRQANHFIYIENQFFITATGDKQSPIKNNLIGSAIVERILRAARSGQKFKIIVVMPAIPGFAGDLKDDASLGTRAIMEYQYNSINRGGHSIMEEIANAGFDPLQYIRWYNLRNYDRINTSSIMQQAEQKSGIDYEAARRDYDHQIDPVGYERSGEAHTPSHNEAVRYQKAANEIKDHKGLRKWDSITEAVMLHGPDIREIPWEGEESEMDAFVQEELYVHTKVMVVDDRIVVCGSANLNDRSMLGTHDSEIALVIEDHEPLDSYMDGQPWRANRFAATLRRQLVRKHLGLIPAQNFERSDDPNFAPAGVPNAYDYGSPEDILVSDPLSDHFMNFWNGRARQNTEAFKIFKAIPDDTVKTWADYEKFYEQYFHDADEVAEGKAKKSSHPSGEYRWGHVVAENFSPGEQGVREVKEILSTIKGTLVEMPLLFLINEDIARGFSLNIFTEEVYT